MQRRIIIDSKSNMSDDAHIPCLSLNNRTFCKFCFTKKGRVKIKLHIIVTIHFNSDEHTNCLFAAVVLEQLGAALLVKCHAECSRDIFMLFCFRCIKHLITIAVYFRLMNLTNIQWCDLIPRNNANVVAFFRCLRFATSDNDIEIYF